MTKTPRAPLPTVEVTQQQMATAFIRYTRETGLELNASNFALHLHPELRSHWIQWSEGFIPTEIVRMVVDRNEFLGFKIVEDPTVDPAHPVLRCTWAMTL